MASDGRGWRESPGRDGKAPEHKKAALKVNARSAMNTPMRKIIMTTRIKEIENEYKNGYITFEELQTFTEQAQEGMEVALKIHPESKTYNRYRIQYSESSGNPGKWSGWRKCDMTEKEFSIMIGSPRIQKVEWKNV